MNEPLVSMGLCVWNGEKYLRDSLDSLLAQTHKNFELVISDNASKDRTQEICEEYAARDKRIRYIRQEKNIGSFANYDFVRSEARGEYFMYVSDDDLWDPRFIEKCLAQFEKDSQALVAFPNFCTFDDSGRVMKYEPQKYFPFPKDLYLRLKAYLLSRGQYGKSTIIYGLWKKGTAVDGIKLDQYKSDMFYIFNTLLLGHFAAVSEILLFKRLPVQFPIHTDNPKPSLHYLTTLPSNFLYESVDDWIRTRKKTIKGRGFVKASKEFVADRIQSTKYTYLYAIYILKSPALSFTQKFKLLWWNKYAYFRSFWYGHV